MPDRPNVLFVMTDQHRGDAVGADPACPTINGDPVVHTPSLNNLVDDGTLFSRGYTPIPSCVPARRCLLTGQTPATNGCPKWLNSEWDFENPMPRVFRDAGYQTQLVGKHHGRPPRKHCGFEHMLLHTAGGDDYRNWLERKSDGDFSEISHGCNWNSWDARPSHLPEHLHPTTWTTERALDFFDRRDPTRPFFLMLSYHRPHQPFDPPQPYWDMYADRDLPGPAMGDWTERVADLIPQYPELDAPVADLPDDAIHRARVGYYGLITHIDHQLQRVFRAIPDDTVILFTSDHGEMLGDHNHWRKTYGYEGSARVPFLFNHPDRNDEDVVSAPVGLEDVMPTLLDSAGISIPETVEGRSILSLLDDGPDVWRDVYHGEHAPHYDQRLGAQYLVEERYKYQWNPVTGEELLADLDADPLEETNLVDDPAHAERVAGFRGRLVEELTGRPEGFVQDGRLSTVEWSAWDVWE